MNHPVSYISGLFHGYQLNVAALMKIAYAIYMSVKKSMFYLTGHEITLRSNHLPLKKFLRKMTLNHMVNNWSTKIESFIKFVHISGKDNVLADALSRLIDMDPDVEKQPELKDYEFRKYSFKMLPKARGFTHHQVIGGDDFDVCEIQITYDNAKKFEFSIELPLDDKKIHFSTGTGQKIQELWDKVKKGMYNEFYLIKNNVLFKHVIDNGQGFEARVIPNSLVDVLLHLGHDQSGHNGYQRIYAEIKCLYYWKCMRMQILQYCKCCKVCALQKVQKTQFEKQIFESGVQPMEFVSMIWSVNFTHHHQRGTGMH